MLNRSLAEEDRLIRENERLAYFHLKKFGRLFDEDARSAAFEGLWKAARTFDASKGASFGTYASVCIYNSIGMYLRKAKRAADHEAMSLEDEISDGFTLADAIPDKHTPESVYLASEAIADMHLAYSRVFSKTSSEKQREVMRLWYESRGDMTQQEIANTTGYSQSYVSRVISATKHKIRTELEEYV